MLEKLEEAVADEEPALVQETNGVQATKMEAAAVGAPAPAKIAAVAVAEPPKKVEKKVVVEEEKVAVSEPRSTLTASSPSVPLSARSRFGASSSTFSSAACR